MLQKNALIGEELYLALLRWICSEFIFSMAILPLVVRGFGSSNVRRDTKRWRLFIYWYGRPMVEVLAYLCIDEWPLLSCNPSK